MQFNNSFQMQHQWAIHDSRCTVAVFYFPCRLTIKTQLEDTSIPFKKENNM